MLFDQCWFTVFSLQTGCLESIAVNVAAQKKRPSLKQETDSTILYEDAVDAATAVFEIFFVFLWIQFFLFDGI